MPHQVHLRTLKRPTDHRLAMLQNLAVAVLRYERVRTTEAKAKEVRRFVDRAIGLGRDGTLRARRKAIGLLRDRLIVEKLFEELGSRYPDRSSGFTRLVRLGHRVGDGAPMMLVELVEATDRKPEERKVKEEQAAAPKSPLARARATARSVVRRGPAEKAEAEGERKAKRPKKTGETKKKEKSARGAAERSPRGRRKEKSD